MTHGTDYSIAIGSRRPGIRPEEIVFERPYLTLAQVYAALTYYDDNREAIDAEIAEYYQEFERLSAEYKAGKLP